MIYLLIRLQSNLLQIIIQMLKKAFSLAKQFFFTTYPPSADLSSPTGTFIASQMTRQFRKDLLPLPQFSPETLPFGKFNTDHMIAIDYDQKDKWGKPKMMPFDHLSIHPFTSSLHYGIQCFEGLKAYKNEKGEVRLFRPWCNALRLKRASTRLTLPDFDGNELVKVISQLVKCEERWIHPKSEFSLYIRPIHIATDVTLGVHSPQKSQLIVMTCPVGPYYSTGYKPISLSCATNTIRSAPKGTGSFKIGGNYAPTLRTGVEVAAKNHQQALWLLGNQIIEVGSSNIFFVFKDQSGIEIATPELQDLILPGVTRDSILELLRSENRYRVSQRKITIDEVIARQKKGELLECFGSGTAVIVSGVKNIQYNGINYAIPYDQKLQIGKISCEIRMKILDIQEGRAQDKFGWVHRVK